VILYDFPFPLPVSKIKTKAESLAPLPFDSAQAVSPSTFVHSSLLTVPERGRREGRELVERQSRTVGMTSLAFDQLLPFTASRQEEVASG